MQDTTTSIFRSVKHFLSGTLLSRITGLLRDVTMAAAFGTQGPVAALLMAFRFSHLLRRIFGEGALQSAFAPHFEELRKDNPLRAAHFFNDLLMGITVLLSGIILLSMVGLGSLLVFGNLSDGNDEILLLTLLMMPGLLFICLYGVNASLLQCEQQFFIPGVAPVLFNGIWTLGVLCLWKVSDREAMPLLAIMIVLACAAQWLMTLPATLRAVRSLGLQTLFTRTWSLTADLKALAPMLSLGILGIAAAQINTALDAIFARYADLSGPAYLWYAIRIQQLPLALFGVALSGALLPPLARAVKGEDWQKFQTFLEYGIRKSATLMIPITMVILVAGDSAINLLYGRGDFSDASIIHTTYCLWGYALGLLPMTLVLLVAPAFWAQGNYRIPTMASLISVAINCGLNAWMVLGMGWGAASVALATSVSAWVNLWILHYFLRKQTHVCLYSEGWISVSRTVGVSLIAGVILVGYQFFEGSPSLLLGLWEGKLSSYSKEFLIQVMNCGMIGGVYYLSLIAMSYLCHARDLFQLISFQLPKDQFS